MELRRAASGLVKVICRTEESRPGGRGRKPGKPKKKGLLASFEEWFGSINMMNILYVWFPASWGPSVVEAIQTRNVTCLAKKPIVRDPHIFDRKEAARGSRAREVTCRIQKWNIKAEGFHPILVANARVDWLAMDDDDITKKFPILLEGILQDVFSQRAASAWQGAQPQKLTVSMFLPGTSSAAEWRDLLQSRRQFWPTLTTRHASLVPVSAEALQRERRQMQAKHLWYNVDIRWVDLKDKLEVLAPTGLTRDDIWRHLFLTKQRKNPYEEGCYTGEVFFYCIAELAIKPCRSSRSKLRGEFGIPKHLQNRKQKHDKATNTPNPKHNAKQKGHGKCLEGETRGEKRVKRPKRPNALICRTPGGSIRYPLSCSLGMTLISHSIVSIPASPSRFDI